VESDVGAGACVGTGASAGVVVALAGAAAFAPKRAAMLESEELTSHTNKHAGLGAYCWAQSSRHHHQSRKPSWAAM
jgi:hypothetical protein